ncbi:MAG: adenylyl-sulfate kinase [Chloroflexi bacterium]|nr:adenylyl-sulfate kinase [Chloroflexota bacterium]
MIDESTGFVIWLTGLPASGKSSLAYAVQEQLQTQQVSTVVLDSDELRRVLTPNPDFTDAERSWFYTVITHLASHLAQSGSNVLIAATGNLCAYREPARRQISRFAEVYLMCPLVVCQRRDPKGIYVLAEQDEADFVPGVNVPYEPPFAPEVVVDMARLLPDVAAGSVIRQLRLNGVIQGGVYGNSQSTAATTTLSSV